MIKADYIKISSSLGSKLIAVFLFLITFPAFLNSQPYLQSGINLKEYLDQDYIMPAWMIYNRKIEDLPRAPYKNLKRKIFTFPSRNGWKIILDYNRNGIQRKYSRYNPSNVVESESYYFTNDGLIDNIYEEGSDDQKGFFYHFEFDKYKRLIKVWDDFDEKGTRIEYPNDFECIEYPSRKGDLIKRIKWNKEGIILSCEADNHYGERYTYKYDPKTRIAFSIRFSKYDKTRIDSSFYNENLNLLYHKDYYKDTNKTGKLELYSSDKDEYVYGSDGRLREEYNYNAAGQLERKHIYEHNKTPDYKEFIETTYYLLSNTVSKYIERYNIHNKLIWKSDWTNSDGEITEEYERNRYLDTLLLEKDERYRLFYYHEKYKYDKYGNVIETISFDSTGRVTKRDHTFRKNEVTKDQLGRVISIKKYENSSVVMAIAFEYYDDEIKTDRNAENTHGINWYIVFGAAGIFCIIAFSYYLLKKRKSL